MILVKPYAIILNISHPNPVRFTNLSGRLCYKSDTPDSPEAQEKFILERIKNGHESILEHVSVTVKVVCDRGVSHELVRHRLCSFSQESTRYCNYKKLGIAFIIPGWTGIAEGIYEDGQSVLFYNDNELKWLSAMRYAQQFYNELLNDGWTPQQARSVLPNSLKTELIMTTNLREWRHIFSLRCDKSAHPQMREIMLPLLNDFHEAMPSFFSELYHRFLGGSSEQEESARLD